MASGFLTRDQGARSAIIFLNNLGLKLEEPKEGLHKDAELKVLNSANEQVGILYFDDEYIKIKAGCTFGTLSAEYKRIYYNVLVNKETGKKYLEWVNNIRFGIFKNARENIKGAFSVTATINEDGEKSVVVQPSPIKYLIDGKKIFDFSFLQNEDMFSSIIGNEQGHEEIICKDNAIIHRKKTATGSDEILVFDDKDDIAAQYIIYSNSNISSFGDIVREKPEANSKKKIDQMTRMMQEADPDINKRIQEIKNIFSLGEIDLVSNFFNATSPSDNVYNLLGIDKKPVVYQNGSTDIVEAYFSSLDEKDKQKELVKK